MDLQEMALQQILCKQVQQLKTSASLIITSRQVSMMDEAVWGHIKRNVYSPCTFHPWCLQPIFCDRFLTASIVLPTQECMPPAASSPPGMYGQG
jgi:hypothetical protein